MRPLYPWDGLSVGRNPTGKHRKTLERKEKAMQTSSKFIARMGAVAAMLGGTLWAAKAFYDRNDAPPWPTDVTDTLFFVVLLLFLGGLARLYARCRGRLGEWEALSSVAFAAGFVGLVGSIAGHVTGMLEVGPSWSWGISWWMFVFGFFVMNLGLLFLGNSILQSRALPRGSALPVEIGALGILLILVSDPANSPLGVYLSLVLWMLYGLFWAALGYVLLAERDESVTAGAPQSGELPRLEPMNARPGKKRS